MQSDQRLSQSLDSPETVLVRVIYHSSLCWSNTDECSVFVLCDPSVAFNIVDHFIERL